MWKWSELQPYGMTAIWNDFSALVGHCQGHLFLSKFFIDNFGAIY